MKIDEHSTPRATEANLILTFHDEVGREFLAAAICGQLISYSDGRVIERHEVETLKDRAFSLVGIKVIHHE